MRTITTHIIALVLLLAPFTAFAQSLENPLAFGTVSEFIAAALRALVQISLPIIGLAIVYSGFLFVTARGDTNQITQARNNFMWVVIGAILVLGAWALAQLLGGTIDQLQTGI